MNIKLGDAARELRETLGITQRDAAAALDITDVHLCNVEKNRSVPSPALMDKYREKWGIDLYVFAWCRHGKTSDLPKPMQKAASTLLKGWNARLESVAEESRTDSGE
ncbi:MAG: helix-turn-helix domain-containing protein [Pirellulales bacterium]|nr:helix-turn-helix domain-containing protein [Pirellulales bacterium]